MENFRIISKRSIFFFIKIILGLFFLITGGAKAFEFTFLNQFILDYIITNIFFSYLLSGTIIFLEVLSGICLILNVKVKSFLLLLLVFLSISVILLIIIFVRFGNAECPCFGSIQFSMPLSQHIFFNTAIMILLFRVYVDHHNKFNLSKKKNLNVINVFSVLAILFITTTIVLNYSKSDNLFQNRIIDLKKLHVDSPQYNDNEYIIILFLDDNDFYCSLCIKDFKEMMAKLLINKTIQRIYILLQKTVNNPSFIQKVIQSYQNAYNLQIKISNITKDIFEENKIEKSSILITNNLGEIKAFYEMPIGRRNMDKILHLLLTN